MKMNIKQLLSLLVFGAVAFSCVDADKVNQARETSVGDPRLDIEVFDAAGSPVSGAVVSFFLSADDYINEANVVATATTDASGMVSVTATDMGYSASDLGEATCCGQVYFSVAAGNLRNWSSTVNTPYLYWSSGPTVVSTTVDGVLTEFIDLIANSWVVTGYDYPGDGNIWGFQAACGTDDVFTFLKTGELIRAEGASVCDEPDSYQSPVSVEGEVWSPWALLDAATISIRDIDPFWDAAGLANSEAGFSITAGTSVTIDFGGGYVATLEAL
ncbi:MAG: hypothetical protein CMP48_18690 [Rickettsiales bacterium]|nr:hypothetical protein [Rickettsiales bacterium]